MKIISIIILRKKLYLKYKIYIYIIFLIIYLKKIKVLIYNENNNPKISVFIPIYNREKYLERSISSVQNQNLKEIEIIAINDGSIDNSLKILKKLMKKDKRIKIFNNDRNHGPLYSRAMGILNSTGYYLMNLDSDDKLVDDYSLKILYKNQKYYKTDIIYYLIKRVPLFKNQTKLYDYINKNQLNSEDYIITNKLIKRELYLKVFQILKSRIYGPKWIIHDDNIWNTLVKKYSFSSSIIHKYIYYYKRNLDSLNFKFNSALDLISRIYRLESYQKYDSKSDIIGFPIKLNSIMKVFDNNEIDYIYKEIRNKLKHIIIEYININYKYLDRKYLKELIYIINKISNKKFIILYNKNFIPIYYSTFKKIIKFLKKKRQKYLFVSDNNISKILNYIFPNDILIGFNDVFIGDNSKIIINLSKYNKFVILVSHNSIIDKYNDFKNNSNFIFKKIKINIF